MKGDEKREAKREEEGGGTEGKVDASVEVEAVLGDDLHVRRLQTNRRRL